jgi:transcriptional regulator with XRE-family HTH domain
MVGKGGDLVARRIPPYAPVIRYLRESHRLSRAEFAGRLGLPDYYVGYFEDGYRFPRPRQVEQIARVFGWKPFEFALLADVDIPYPDWPALSDLPAWLRLARQWVEVADAIARYATARWLADHPDWLERYRQQHPDLADQVDRYGFVAIYGAVRQDWQAWGLPDGRSVLPEDYAGFLQALAPDPNRPARTDPVRAADARPPFWDRLDDRERAAIETIARGLIRERGETPSEGPA